MDGWMDACMHGWYMYIIYTHTYIHMHALSSRLSPTSVSESDSGGIFAAARSLRRHDVAPMHRQACPGTLKSGVSSTASVKFYAIQRLRLYSWIIKFRGL